MPPLWSTHEQRLLPPSCSLHEQRVWAVFHPMRFVSTFAGVGGFDLGFERAGLACVGQVEIDKKCVEILANHWPDLDRHDDLRQREIGQMSEELPGQSMLFAEDSLVKMSPSLEYARDLLGSVRIVLLRCRFQYHTQAEVVVLENVPGLLGNNKGRDFGTVVTTLAKQGIRTSNGECWTRNTLSGPATQASVHCRKCSTPTRPSGIR